MMNETYEKTLDSLNEGHDRAAALVGRLFEIAEPHAVFSEPVEAEEHTVLTASEVVVGMGYGFGSGGGTVPKAEQDDEASSTGDVGAGGGGGGGGYATGRPVAAIEIGSNGVRVEPIVDVTKISLAFFTMFGSMVMMFARMRKNTKK